MNVWEEYKGYDLVKYPKKPCMFACRHSMTQRSEYYYAVTQNGIDWNIYLWCIQCGSTHGDFHRIVDELIKCNSCVDKEANPLKDWAKNAVSAITLCKARGYDLVKFGDESRTYAFKHSIKSNKLYFYAATDDCMHWCLLVGDMHFGTEFGDFEKIAELLEKLNSDTRNKVKTRGLK